MCLAELDDHSAIRGCQCHCKQNRESESKSTLKLEHTLPNNARVRDEDHCKLDTVRRR